MASPQSSGADRSFDVVIVGGGSGGITVAARLRRKSDAKVAVVEPSSKHYYQPLWTLVGAGVVPKEVTEREEESLIPRGTTWIRDAVSEFRPDSNLVLTEGGERIGYSSLVVAAGIRVSWDAVKGLEGNVGQYGICSNYGYTECETTWQAIRDFKGGTAIFTMPPPPIKCAGAPQKIAYLADDHFRREGVRDRTRIIYAAGTPGIFAAPDFAAPLNRVIERKGIETRYRHNLVELRPGDKEAVFVNLDSNEEVALNYDMIHVTPPQGPPDPVRRSPLADAAGWVEVDKSTTQHVRYPNVFSLGDASSLPTSKTGAAVHKQAPVLVDNLLATMNGRPLRGSYDGYAACPLTTGYGKLLLAEFDYDLKPAPTIPLLDPTKERWSYYQLKRYGLPFLYWHGMLKGRW